MLTNSDIHRCKRARGYSVTRHRSSHSIAFVQNQRMSKRCGPLPVAGWNLRILVHGHAGSILECRFMILKVYSPKIVPLWSKFILKKRNTIGPLAYFGGDTRYHSNHSIVEKVTKKNRLRVRRWHDGCHQWHWDQRLWGGRAMEGAMEGVMEVWGAKNGGWVPHQITFI